MNIGARIGLPIGDATRSAFGDTLAELGAEYPSLVVVDGDVGNSTYTERFGRRYPERFFNVGITESNMVGVAAGLALSGHIAVTSSFASQMGIEDLALMCAVPGMVVLSPADAASARVLTRQMIAHVGPVYMRTGRPKVPVIYPADPDLQIGRAETIRQGGDVTLIATGLMVAAALEAAHDLARDGVEARVLDVHTVKPIDRAAVVAAARETGGIVTAESHLLNGGLGSMVARVVAREAPCRMGFVGLDDTYAESGKPDDVLAKFGLSAAAIAAEARRVLG
mgnify:CR=1 FL=1